MGAGLGCDPGLARWIGGLGTDGAAPKFVRVEAWWRVRLPAVSGSDWTMWVVFPAFFELDAAIGVDVVADGQSGCH